MSNIPSYSIAKALKQFKIEIAAVQSRNLVNDSRVLKRGDVFCGVIGHNQDGRQYIEQVIAAGAVLVIVQCQNSQQHGNIIWRKVLENDQEKSVAIIQFYQLNEHLFALAKAYYQSPQSQLNMIGITGTNGKTSTSQIIAKLLDASDKACGVIGTTGAGRVDNLQPIENTTPGATELHQLFAGFVTNSLTDVAMEVSSHALSQHRVTGRLFDIAVFTNLTRDHLDYHETMTRYAQAKRSIFTRDNTQTAILNGDDELAQQWLETWPLEQPVMVYGRCPSIKKHACYIYASNIEHHASGANFTIASSTDEVRVSSPLMGDFNIDNLLAAISVLLVQGLSLSDVAKKVIEISPIIGRMETFSAENKPTAIVDYAHSPDALENALIACRQHCKGELWVVFGCGGDRDKGKRSLMGKVAEGNAEHVVITNDNPRSEAPELIAQDILSGCEFPEKVTVMIDRKQAVLATLSHAKADDMVLFAGKGHEDYVIIGDKKHEYNERKVVGEFYLNEAIS